MTEMQRQFEEWAHDDSKGYKLKLWHLINKDGDKVYTNALTSDMWQAWQDAWTVSRAEIVVTLPETHNDWLDKQIVQHALQKEGIRYE